MGNDGGNFCGAATAPQADAHEVATRLARRLVSSESEEYTQLMLQTQSPISVDSPAGAATNSDAVIRAMRDYTANLNSRVDESQQEAIEHGGQLVARSLDGTRTFAYADTDEELVEQLVAQGIDPQTVVFGRVPSVDEGYVP